VYDVRVGRASSDSKPVSSLFNAHSEEVHRNFSRQCCYEPHDLPPRSCRWAAAMIVLAAMVPSPPNVCCAVQLTRPLQSICFPAAQMATLRCGTCALSRYDELSFCIYIRLVNFNARGLIDAVPQSALSVSGVGDGITSMAVHPHLPILAVGSMGQVSQYFFIFKSTSLNRSLSGCSHVFGLNRRISTPNPVRCHCGSFSSLLLCRSVARFSDRILIICRYHDGFLGQRIGPISCVAFHPFQASFPLAAAAASAARRDSVTMAHHSDAHTPLQRTLAAGAIDCIVSLYGAQVCTP